MKYWLLTSEYPPFFGGGISTYCANTARMLSEKGHSVSVFVNDNAVSNIKIDYQGNIRVVRFNPSRMKASSFLGYTTNISYEFAHLVKHFIEKEGKPDIIEAQEYLGIAYYLLQYKHLLYDWCKDILVIITMHSPSILYMEYNQVPIHRYPNYWICEMERFCLLAADQVISPSEYLINELKKRAILFNKNIVVIPNPFKTINDIQLDNNAKSKPGQIIFYGKLTAQKGAFQLLDYFQKLWDKGFSRPLYLLGTQNIVYHPENIAMGDLIKKKYEAYIQNGLLKMENKILPHQINNRIAIAEVVIVPSNNDNLPYVVLEMMSLGKIVLVSKQGGQSEIVEHGVDGFIFDHNNPETFFLQLDKILNLSKEERNVISYNAIQKVTDRYRPEVIYEEKIKIIDNILLKKQTLNLFPFVRHLEQPRTTPKPEKEVKDKLSIVVPYFNMGKYIVQTIQSLLQSEYSNKEIIIINDGSSDKNSIETLNQYRNESTIKIIDTLNSGLAKARNIGAAEASGEYLAFLDGDDTIEKNYYTLAIRILAQYKNVHFVGCWTQYFENSDKVWPAFQPEPPLILFHNLINSSSLVYKRSSFINSGQNDGDMMFSGLEDYESAISLLANGYNGVAIPETLFHYRVRSDSMIRKISKTKKLLLYDYIANKHKRFYATFAAEVFGLLNANGPGILLDNPSLDYHLAEKIPFGGNLSRKLAYLVKKNKFTQKMAYKFYRLLNK